MRTIFACVLLTATAAAQLPNTTTAHVNDPLSHGTLGDNLLSLDEAIRHMNQEPGIWAAFSAAEIARKKGIPGSTVRSHLKRGLDELRHELDRLHGGKREVWSAVLLPWLDVKPETALAPATALASGVLTMSTGTKLGLAAAVVAVAVVGYGVLEPDGERPERGERASEVAHAADVVAPQRPSEADTPNTPTTSTPPDTDGAARAERFPRPKRRPKRGLTSEDRDPDRLGPDAMEALAS